MFDLYIYPFGYKNNEEYASLTGFFVGNVLKKATRTRAEDIIVFRFTPFRKITSEENVALNGMVSSTSEYFYKSKGPITTAAKKTVEFFNDQLIRLNSKNRDPLLGSIHFLILNKDDLYFLHAGGATSILLSRTNVKRYEDRAPGVEGIGIGKSVRLRFFHSKINLNDRIILTSKPPKSWTDEALLDDQRLSISHLRRTLIQNNERDFEAIIIQLRKGNGSVRQLKLDSSDDSSSETNAISQTGKEVQDEEQPSVHQVQDEKVEHDDTTPMHEEEVYSFAENTIPDPIVDFSEFSFEDFDKQNQQDRLIDLDEKESPPEDLSQDIGKKPEGLFISGEKWEPAVETTEKIQIKPRKERKSNSFAIFLLKSRAFVYKLNLKVNHLKSRMKSGFLKGIQSTNLKTVDDNNSLSSSSMLMITIMVAIIVSAIGITVYFQSGIGSQQRELIANVNLLVSDALGETNLNNKALLYEEALRLVIESESYGKSEDISELKIFIQSEIDEIKGITRLDVQSTIVGGLDRRIQITRMAINSSGDLFALDAGTGRVIRMISTRSDYIVDTTFSCGPGKYGDVIVDALVDIEPVNFANQINTTLMGIDGRGNLLLCIQGADPIGIKLQSSDMNWGEIKALAFNGYSLYILDAGEITRDIYRYQVNDYAFDENPESLFASNIPENLTGSLDISVDQEELFLIHQDGELTRCSLTGSFTASSCATNIGYGVIVDGQSRENLSVISGTQFDQIYQTLPPDPSIYFLDTNSRSIYHFSMSLNLQQQIRPNLGSHSSIDDNYPLTSFAVSPNGLIHFAYDNQIFYGFLP